MKTIDFRQNDEVDKIPTFLELQWKCLTKLMLSASLEFTSCLIKSTYMVPLLKKYAPLKSKILLKNCVVNVVTFLAIKLSKLCNNITSWSAK